MTLATMPELAAEYYVCVAPDDVDNTLQQVRRGTEGWVALKGSFEEAFSRYCWRFPDAKHVRQHEMTVRERLVPYPV